MSEGKDEKGRFARRHKLATGRPRGARNKAARTFFSGEVETPVAYRFRLLLDGITGDLGGKSALSTGELQIARRCAFISTQCEIMERQAAIGETFDVTAYGTLTGHLVRALNALGFKRVPKDVTPTLQHYLDAAAVKPADEQEDGQAADLVVDGPELGSRTS
jgi:hypothetical protein